MVQGRPPFLGEGGMLEGSTHLLSHLEVAMEGTISADETS